MILKNLRIVGRETNLFDIKIERGIISEIKPAGTESNEYSNDFEGSIAFPGIINSHDHLEFNLYPQLRHRIYNDYTEWGKDIHAKDTELIKSIEAIPVELRMKFGIIKNLLNGVTAVAHHGAYHECFENSPVYIIQKGTCIHSVRLGNKWKIKLNWPKNLAPYVIHAGEGLNKESYDEINELNLWNLFKRKIIGIHGIAMTPEQSKNFEALIWCPVSNLFLFNKTAAVSELKKHTKILFGTDSTLTAGANIWDHLRAARKMNHLTDAELFDSVNKTPAHVWGLKNNGDISEGRIADLVITAKKSENSFESFYRNNPEDILLIMKSGKIILFDESVKGFREMTKGVKFDEVNVNGRIKFVNYGVNEFLNELKKLLFKSGIEKSLVNL